MTIPAAGDAIHDIHDHYFVALLSYPDHADALVRERLPAEAVATLTSAPPEPVDTTYIDQELRDHISDRMFRVRSTTQRESLIYLVFDHKSSPHRQMAWQFLRYTMRALEQWVRDNPHWVTLPQIVPILIYHGQREWHIADELLALVEAEPSLRPYLLNFRFLVVDLSRIDDNDLSNCASLRAGLLALKYAFREQQQPRVLEQIGLALRQAPMAFLYQTLKYLLQTFKSLNRSAMQRVIQQARPSIQPQEVTAMMSQFAQENIYRGRQEGESSILIRLLRRRFSDLPGWVEPKVLGADTDALEQWSDRILDAQSLQDIFGDETQPTY
ncbi:MAG: Rpn family recombination-promoting nuclease/putative transposase [Magnetococcales bacterium]|nr:Rpn family recombination-promoting nuclease/putative transposase [Magnetococcales bacterium]